MLWQAHGQGTVFEYMHACMRGSKRHACCSRPVWRLRGAAQVWDAYLRKKREKRALRKEQGRLRNLDDR